MKLWTLEIHEDGTDHDANFVAVAPTMQGCLEKWERDLLEWDDEGIVGALREALEAIRASARKAEQAGYSVHDGVEDIWWFRFLQHEV